MGKLRAYIVGGFAIQLDWISEYVEVVGHHAQEQTCKNKVNVPLNAEVVILIRDCVDHKVTNSLKKNHGHLRVLPISRRKASGVQELETHLKRMGRMP